VNSVSVEVDVVDPSQVGEARRVVQRLANAAGIASDTQSNASIVATELATNLVIHAQGGKLIVRCDDRAVELLAIDRGQGMHVDRCLEDGYSTSGTAGNGLGAVRRLSSQFDAFSSGQGSVLWARVGQRQPCSAIGAVCLPYPGETSCGDDWKVVQHDAGWDALVVDGLGHGLLAAEAAHLATSASLDDSPTQVLRKAHTRMAGSRGAAAASVRYSRTRGALDFASVGNICATIVTATGARGLPAQNGTLAAHLPTRINESTFEAAPSSKVVLHTDGIKARWSLAAYPGLWSRHPAVIAGLLARDFRRDRDDASVLVLEC